MPGGGEIPPLQQNYCGTDVLSKQAQNHQVINKEEKMDNDDLNPNGMTNQCGKIQKYWCIV
jgi:hypothetical protein